MSNIKQQIDQFIWHQAEFKNIIHREFVTFLRIMSLVVKDLMKGMLTLRSMSLVYTTLLSLVPLIAVSFSVLKGFGVHNQVEPLLQNMLSSLGDKGPEITAQIIGFVDNMKIGVLGSVGMVMLLYTVISLIHKIETAFNFTWRINTSRKPAQRFSNYLSIVMVGPVMVFAAIGLTASLSNNAVIETLNEYESLGQMIHFLGLLIPYLLIILAFTFIYLLVPNIRVNFKSALYGAFFAGIVWELLGKAFASFASGSTSYTAIYSGFAIMILFMIWLYLGWLVLLTGANIAFYHQHPERMHWDVQNRKALVLNPALREQAVLQIMLIIAQGHLQSINKALTRKYLASQLNIPNELSVDLLNDLQNCNLIKKTNEKPAQWLPAKSLELISIAEIIDCARQDPSTQKDNPVGLKIDPNIQTMASSINQKIHREYEMKTLSELAKAGNDQ